MAEAGACVSRSGATHDYCVEVIIFCVSTCGYLCGMPLDHLFEPFAPAKKPRFLRICSGPNVRGQLRANKEKSLFTLTWMKLLSPTAMAGARVL